MEHCTIVQFLTFLQHLQWFATCCQAFLSNYQGLSFCTSFIFALTLIGPSVSTVLSPPLDEGAIRPSPQTLTSVERIDYLLIWYLIFDWLPTARRDNILFFCCPEILSIHYGVALDYSCQQPSLVYIMPPRKKFAAAVRITKYIFGCIPNINSLNQANTPSLPSRPSLPRAARPCSLQESLEDSNGEEDETMHQPDRGRHPRKSKNSNKEKHTTSRIRSKITGNGGLKSGRNNPKETITKSQQEGSVVLEGATPPRTASKSGNPRMSAKKLSRAINKKAHRSIQKSWSTSTVSVNASNKCLSSKPDNFPHFTTYTDL